MVHGRLNLSDWMILVSVSALGLAAARWWYGLPGYVSQSSLDVQSVSEMVAWLLFPMSPALIAIRLREPRPPWRRLVRQPGFQANLVVCLAAITETLHGSWGYTPEWHQIPLGTGVSQPQVTGPTLLIGWMLTALVGRRRPDPGAIDRLGRAVGWGWIAIWATCVIFAENSLVAIFL